MIGIKKTIDELLKEKGQFSIASLTLSEFNDYIQEIEKRRESTPQYKEVIIEKHFNADEHRLIGQNELCKILDISKSTLYNLRAEGIIPEYLVHNTPKFNVIEVLQALKLKTCNTPVTSSSCSSKS